MVDAIIVTGSSGQLGREITKQLLDDNYFVIGMDKDYDPYYVRSNNFEFIQVDLKKKKEIGNGT